MKIQWNDLLFGKPRDPADPAVYKHITLVALLAWVGLGADGLSSACYGPEATFKALGEHRDLAPWLVLATIVTVSVLSAAYSGTISAFPSGGGGYSVATRTLGRSVGMICGCALVLDYVLTVGISIAAGADAVFSLLPERLHGFKIEAAVAGVLALMWLNYRGVKESVMAMLPLFVLFLATHALLIGMAVLTPAPAAVATAGGAVPLGLGAAALLILKAYSHGAGTYTGIEAISNSLTILREPRVRTARLAMLYMAISLSAVAGGLLVGYLRCDVAPVEGKTLNAALALQVFGTGPWGNALVFLTLGSEAALLFVAAQAGFIDGPRVLASMAVDSWVPRWFSRLSDRLVVGNGIFLIGAGGIAAVLLTGGHVEMLVIVYSFSVFVTFLLSQVGMTRYWIQHRERGWRRRALVSLAAAGLSALVLGALLLTYGFGAAGAALAAILALASVSALVKAHYGSVGRGLQRLDAMIPAIEADPHRREPRPFDKAAPTAVLLVSGYNGAGIHLLMALQHHFPDYFPQMVFVSAGVVDFDRFKGQAEVENLRASVRGELTRYTALVGRWGIHGESRMAIGVDAVDELVDLAGQVARDYPGALFFSGDVVFRLPSLLTPLLHARTATELQRRLSFRGLPLIILPIRVGEIHK